MNKLGDVDIEDYMGQSIKNMIISLLLRSAGLPATVSKRAVA
jgi:hypothetical protein